VYSEKELNQGFADLTLIPLLFQYPAIKYSYLIELKYIKPSDYEKKDGADKVENLRSEATRQLTQYSLDEKFMKTVSHTTLKKLILIFSGNKLIHHSEI
ncbi:MAG: PD-(D/E)XK nuclease domain-containing protein, partial [Candidatus Omnitrophota bacterium]